MKKPETPEINTNHSSDPVTDFTFDDSQVYELLNHDRLKVLDVTKPHSPDVLWTLISNYRGNGTISFGEITAHRNYLDHRCNYFSYLHSQGIKVKPNTLDKLGDSNNAYPSTIRPSTHDIILMMDDCITDLSKEAKLKGSISIQQVGFAKICINYTPDSQISLQRSHYDDISSTDEANLDTHAQIIIDTLNSDLKFEPKYHVSFSHQISQGKLYTDNDLFAFSSVAEKALKQCFFHLLRFSQLQLHKSAHNLGQKALSPETTEEFIAKFAEALEIPNPYSICNKTDAEVFVAKHVKALETSLDTNLSERAVWVSLKYLELSLGKHKTKYIRLFGFKPRSKDGKKLKPLVYVDFNPDATGTPPPFTQEAQRLIDSYDGETFQQNDDLTLLVERITNNAIPKELSGEHSITPMTSLLHYWFIGLYSSVDCDTTATQEPYQIIGTQLRKATDDIDTKPVENAAAPMEISHLFWMLDEITSGSMNPTKSSRWLGYVYATLRHHYGFIPEINTDQLEMFNAHNGGKYKTNRLRSSVEITEGYLVEANELHGSIEFSIDDNSLRNLYAILRYVHRSLLSEMTANFWIGYVQGCMVNKGMLNVNEERDRTRSIFDGM